MKIDLHCHTLATKKGDNKKRTVTREVFLDTLSGKVELVAITNHNYFDLEQYKSFENNENVIVWPGIEIDIIENNKRYHCIVISNPDKIDEFVESVKDLAIEEADDFQINLEGFIAKFRHLDCIVIAHYFTKENAFNDSMLQKLKEGFSDINVFVEPSNMRSATILQAHNYRCLIGSDVADWENYDYSTLPTLKKRISTYDSFKRLLQKDKHVIETTLKEELFETIKVNPFKDHSQNNHLLEYDIYKDVNVFFGGKGTGKSEILLAIYSYFTSQKKIGKVKYFKSKEVTRDYKNKISQPLSDDDFNGFGYPDISIAIKNINEYEENTLTPTAKYYDWKKSQDANKNNKKLGIRGATFTETVNYEKSNNLLVKLKDFNEASEKVSNIVTEEEALDEAETNILVKLLQKMENSIFDKAKEEWVTNKSLELERFTINKIKLLSESKTGEKSKPTNLGLLNFYNSLKKLNTSITSIINLMELPEKKISQDLGRLEEKGKVLLVRIVSASIHSKKFKFDKGKEKIAALFKSLENTKSTIYGSNFQENIGDLKNKLECFTNSRDLIGYRNVVTLESGAEYNPSDGEQAMLLLSETIISDEYDIYILDEPELSVGHQYINNIIIPRIKELAKLKKVIIVATHDANIAIRTLPYLSVFRKYENGIYYNYIGSSLEDDMKDPIHGVSANWTAVSILTLEGGRDAFDERGRIYG